MVRKNPGITGYLVLVKENCERSLKETVTTGGTKSSDAEVTGTTNKHRGAVRCREGITRAV
ncbi:MAG: hypothetical protein LBF84_00680 [Holosporales bacterium]|jgi:hypothetical protein|nr:hypothetical protein [Holosporales bacterium]